MSSTQDKETCIRLEAKARVCQSCSKLRPDFLRENPHSSTRKKICPFHQPSKKERNREILGAQLEQFTRKCRLSTLIKLPTEKKQQLIDQIEHIVDFNRELMLKATLFTLYYLHHKFLTDDPLPPMVFHQTFFYSVFQLLLNREISSKNRYFPKEELVQAYQQYLEEFPTGGRPIASDASMEARILSITAKNMAVTFANNLVENFESRYIEYLTLRFRELLPVKETVVQVGSP
ncbi:uncharacterized protein BYT42DRAFT_178270 [Radiomyces spectabilis]|uniref:uncharacterized protein n=1 Tax=Radiomyces spectabilis TaxID=64574 RepID=UPI00221F08E8|nr:uncharacterized protein BYT42DRAFT_178270 [Radiomyces spectabilis]KAI8390999.1 hypothetical protein BYT42DRAFT_178270 [Radiomyces spectabilis]